MSDTFQRFVDRFSHGAPAPRALPEDLAFMEQELQAVLPESYRTFALQFGGVYTPAVLRLVEQAHLEGYDIQNILLPREAVADTRASWSGGMPTDLIVI